MAQKVAKRGPCPRCKERPRSKSSTYCKECGAKKAREEYDKHPERCRKRGRRWRKEHRDKALASQKKYRESERGKKKRRAYRNSPKGKEVYDTWRKSPKGKKAHHAAEVRYRRKLRSLTANLPIEVVRPFVARMVKEADAEHVPGGIKGARSKGSGYRELARITGVSKDTIWDIVNKESLKSVDIGVADKFAMHGDFTLDELYARAEEWAFLTKSPWPEGYFRKQRKAPKRRRKRGNTRRRILQLLKEEPMNQRELADRLGFTNTSAVSKCVIPLEQAGKIEWFKLAGESRRRYRLAQISSG